MTAKEPRWPPEGFRRPSLTTEDTQAILDEIQARMASHFENYGDGIFVHAHEVVGCLFGQMMKLSTAADASNYSGDLSEFRERCLKTLLAVVVAVASVDKLSAAARDVGPDGDSVRLDNGDLNLSALQLPTGPNEP